MILNLKLLLFTYTELYLTTYSIQLEILYSGLQLFEISFRRTSNLIAIKIKNKIKKKSLSLYLMVGQIFYPLGYIYRKFTV